MKKIFTEDQCKAAIERLNSVLPDLGVYNGVLFQQFNNTTVTQDFTRKSIKRAKITGSNFIKSNFSGVAAAGSQIFDSKFSQCDFTGASFQNCRFNRVEFCNLSKIKGANFSHSLFIECRFDDISIIESTLYDCYFENCLFLNSRIQTSTFENSTLRNCDIHSIDLAHTNIEYTRFDNVELYNVILPPYQVPYIIGAPGILLLTKNQVYIYSDNGNVTLDNYCKEYNNLAAYYFARKQYFPLANLLLALGNRLLAFDYIRQGIIEACDYFDFRMIKFYCKLACASGFTPVQLKNLFNLVTDLSYRNTWDISTLHSYMLNIGEIKELLLNNSESDQRVDFVIKTNIDKDNIDEINALYNQINSILKSYGSEIHTDSIELRHNSPYELYITCIDALPNILLIISTMYSVFTVGSKGIDFLKKLEDLIQTHKENKLLDYELAEKKVDIELKKLELAQSKQQSSIPTCSVVELEHILRCNSIEAAKAISSDCLHFKVSNNQ